MGALFPPAPAVVPPPALPALPDPRPVSWEWHTPAGPVPVLPRFLFSGEVPRLHGQRVLVIDDDPQIPLVVKEILEDEGYNVLTASDGREALAILDRETEPFDLILLDMRMAGMNGWDFAAAYRQRPGRHAPLITMTAAHDAAQWAREIDADGVLPKPFELLELLDLVERFTGGD